MKTSENKVQLPGGEQREEEMKIERLHQIKISGGLDLPGVGALQSGGGRIFPPSPLGSIGLDPNGDSQLNTQNSQNQWSWEDCKLIRVLRP